ncbi:hypothetical protein QYF61_011840 [Mycteria americana]|uniref:Uncharacterized protein n=1 Tax=Mycteria americana TaxID=33587 RepID=A0AAN7RVK7_MYCAM|nr:hypothetical protein QYF61_011840 [Mycteria americana]
MAPGADVGSWAVGRKLLLIPIPSCTYRGMIRLLRAPSNLTFNVSRDGASTTSLGNLLNNPNSLSLSSQERYSVPLIIFMALLWTSSNSSMSFLCWGLQSWTQYSSPGYGWPSGTLPAHIQLFIHQYSQVLLSRAAPNLFIPQSILILGVALTQVQDFALGLVEPHEVHMGPLIKLVQVSLDGILYLRHVNHTTQLGVTCKLAEGALHPTVYVIDENIEQHWSQYRPLRDTTCHRSPSGH